MKRLEAEGRIFYTKNGMPRFKRYLDESKGLLAQDVWADIEPLRSWHAERLGYPKQRWGLVVDDDVGHQDAVDDRVHLGLPSAQGLQRIWSECLDGHDEHVWVRGTTSRFTFN